MRNTFISLAVLLCLITACFGCDKMDYSNYKNVLGYEAYVSDRDTGEITPFCGTFSSLYDDTDAISYYNSNCRECDGFLITNYEDGICINKALNLFWGGVRIPETLDGSPVVKLGSYIGDSFVEPFAEGKLGSDIWVTIPKTVKYIDETVLLTTSCLIYSVDGENPYYESDEAGNLYVKQNGKKERAVINRDRM